MNLFLGSIKFFHKEYFLFSFGYCVFEDKFVIDIITCFLSKLVLKGMMKKRYGRIIQITSVVGFTGNPGQVNYAASKSGLIGMSKSLAMEVASRNITVNCVAPGFIDTPMTKALNHEQRSNLEDKIPSRRLGIPGDIGAAVVYLASEEASYVNGATIHVNGGLAMI